MKLALSIEHSMTRNGCRRSVFIVLAALVLVPLLPAQTSQNHITLHLDPAQTQIRWSLRDMLRNVHGTFALKGGIVVFDPATGVAEGELLVDLDTGTSGNAGRDRAMKNNVLQSTTYPEAIFHPEKVTGTLKPDSPQQLTVDGTFTIHGHDHPLRLVVSAQMISGTRAAAKTHFVIPYVAWGMKDPSTLLLHVGKQVSVDVTTQATVDGLH